MTHMENGRLPPLQNYTFNGILKVGFPKRTRSGKGRPRLTRHGRVAEVFSAIHSFLKQTCGNLNPESLGENPPRRLRKVRAALGLNGRMMKEWWGRYRESSRENRVIVPPLGRPPNKPSAKSQFGQAIRWLQEHRKKLEVDLPARFTLKEFTDYCESYGGPRIHPRMMRRLLRHEGLRCSSQIDYDGFLRKPGDSS